MRAALFERTVRDGELALTAGQFAALLRAGLPLPETTARVADATDDRTLRAVLTDCAKRVADGEPLADALARHPGIPAPFVETVRAGERNRRLPEAFRRLRVYCEKRRKTRGKLRAALQYPLFLCALTVLTVYLLTTRLLPSLASALDALGGELPAFTRLLLAATAAVSTGWPFAASAVVPLWALCRLLKRTERGKRLFGAMRLHLPVVGKIALLDASARFADTAALLLPAGLPLPEVLRTAARTVGNPAVAAEIRSLADAVENGYPLGAALPECRRLSRVLCALVSVGDATGTLPSALAEAGAYCGTEAAERAERALNLLEPILTVFAGLLVALLALSVLLPLLTVYSAIGVSI